MKVKKNTSKNRSNITLQELLENQFGKEQVVVKEWKWTPEQLKQLKATKRDKSPLKNHVKV